MIFNQGKYHRRAVWAYAVKEVLIGNKFFEVWNINSRVIIIALVYAIIIFKIVKGIPEFQESYHQR